MDEIGSESDERLECLPILKGSNEKLAKNIQKSLKKETNQEISLCVFVHACVFVSSNPSKLLLYLRCHIMSLI
jgi:hypothetical protein